MASRGLDVSRFVDIQAPAELQREAIAGVQADVRSPILRTALLSEDPFLQTAGRLKLAAAKDLIAAALASLPTDPKERVQWLLACRESGNPGAHTLITRFLEDPDRDVRFLAAKWIADQKLTQYKGLLEKAIKAPTSDTQLYLAYATALARIDGKAVNDAGLEDAFFDRLVDDRIAAGARTMALRLIPATHPKLGLDVLSKLMQEQDAELKFEVVRAVCEHPYKERKRVLESVVEDESLPIRTRAQALVGLADFASEEKDLLLKFAIGKDATLAAEALRSLVDVPCSPAEVSALELSVKERPAQTLLVNRVLGRLPGFETKPPKSDIDAWLRMSQGGGDEEAGRRIFSSPRLAGCVRCHRAEGRGRTIGPDLSTIGRVDRRAILESILQPSRAVAPAYQVWQIATKDGVERSGVLVHTDLDQDSYVDETGNRFTVNTHDVEELRPLTTSIMPDRQVERLTEQELGDLLAYLCSRK